MFAFIVVHAQHNWTCRLCKSAEVSDIFTHGLYFNSFPEQVNVGLTNGFSVLFAHRFILGMLMILPTHLWLPVLIAMRLAQVLSSTRERSNFFFFVIFIEVIESREFEIFCLFRMILSMLIGFLWLKFFAGNFLILQNFVFWHQFFLSRGSLCWALVFCFEYDRMSSWVVSKFMDIDLRSSLDSHAWTFDALESYLQATYSRSASVLSFSSWRARHGFGVVKFLFSRVVDLVFFAAR